MIVDVGFLRTICWDGEDRKLVEARFSGSP